MGNQQISVKREKPKKGHNNRKNGIIIALWDMFGRSASKKHKIRMN
jgi:hypothetical protein